MTTKGKNQIVSKERVADHGEVYTRPQEVSAMLDMVKQETERIESRFLEPACGTGNFLMEIFRRKLEVVKTRYRRSQTEYERNAVLAASSIYGIDILEDNIVECRRRLLELFAQEYSKIFKDTAKQACIDAVGHILKCNIILGDALTLETTGETPHPIVFPEWSPVNGNMMKRRDFTFHGLLEHEHYASQPLFSDLGENVFIPTPEKEYPVVHYLKVTDAV